MLRVSTEIPYDKARGGRSLLNRRATKSGEKNAQETFLLTGFRAGINRTKGGNLDKRAAFG